MIDELREQLEEHYQYAVDGQRADSEEAESARRAGEMETYFDLALYLQLADACWALEKWDDAKRWYRHNARIFAEQRAWRASQGISQTWGMSDWEAATTVRAGLLEPGRQLLVRSVEYAKTQSGSELTLTQLGLHAAQAQLPDLAANVRHVVDARNQIAAGTSAGARQVRADLHYEPAQVALMLGQPDHFRRELDRFSAAARVLVESRETVFPEPLQQALAAAARGLSILASLQAGSVDRDRGRADARRAFEEAMLGFFRFSGQFDWDLYFMRLNTRLADDAAAGRGPNPNPFAD